MTRDEWITDVESFLKVRYIVLKENIVEIELRHWGSIFNSQGVMSRCRKYGCYCVQLEKLVLGQGLGDTNKQSMLREAYMKVWKEASDMNEEEANRARRRYREASNFTFATIIEWELEE